MRGEGLLAESDDTLREGPAAPEAVPQGPARCRLCLSDRDVRGEFCAACRVGLASATAGEGG